MLERIKKLRTLRRKKSHKKPHCPICQIEMKRNGKKGPNEFFRCRKCGGKMIHGMFNEKPNPDTQDMMNYELKALRNQLKIRRFIVREKKKKYGGLDEFRIGGDYILLDDYDKDGISFAEKKALEEARKAEEKVKRRKKKKHENNQ